MISVTKEFGFEMAHSLEGHDGACRRIHGHSYRLWVTVGGEVCDDCNSPKQGMVVDFGELAGIVRRVIVERFDHSFVVRSTDDNAALIAMMADHWQGVIAVDWQPTSENMVKYFAQLLAPELPAGVRLRSLKLSETASSHAELTF